MRRYGIHSDTRIYTDAFEDTWAGQEPDDWGPPENLDLKARPPTPTDPELAAAVAAWIAAGAEATARRAAQRVDQDPGDEHQ